MIERNPGSDLIPKKKQPCDGPMVKIDQEIYTCENPQCSYSDYWLRFMDRSSRNNHQLNCLFLEKPFCFTEKVQHTMDENFGRGVINILEEANGLPPNHSVLQPVKIQFNQCKAFDSPFNPVGLSDLIGDFRTGRT
ncbi:hypothetical protein CDL15_Pgr017008 [Punica granatum]|uniref:Uncharacterized protein n=1 Tax=Punica granatum TaxID=22663 RepID=A0A218WZ31_PUNGR|nr:hypothetical protein CDL15_Pgr017008 [Punica granatum]